MNTRRMYENAVLYDMQNAEDRDDIGFFREKAKVTGGPILELACGTGVLSIPIAESGIEVYGLDLSPEMIGLARQKSSGLKNVHFAIGNMTKFKLDRKFKLIFCGFNSIAHLHSFVELQGMLESAKENLAPDGLLILDCFVPNPKYLVRPKGALYPVYDNGDMKIQEENEYDPVAQVNHIIWHYEYQHDQWIEHLDMRIYYPQELQNYLRICGYEIKNAYGTHAFDMLVPNSPFQIYECTAKA